MQEGDVIRYMGIVQEGYFKYVTTDSNGNEHITGLALPGAFVGELFKYHTQNTLYD